MKGYNLSQEEKAKYKKLSRQVDEAYYKLFDAGTGGRNKTKSNLFNNRLRKMKLFISELEEKGSDFKNNRYYNLFEIN